MFGIKLREEDLWAPAKNITYFVKDDADFALRGWTVANILGWGVPASRRRLFNTTDQIRAALRRISRETVWVGGPWVMCLGSGKAMGTFSHYEVVDLVQGVTHSLDDVLRKRV